MAVRVRVVGSGTLVAWKGRTEKVTATKLTKLGYLGKQP